MPLAFFENIIAPVFYKLLYMSATALAVGIIIMLIRRLADKQFSPFWKYAMWGLLLVALLIPWRPQSSLSIMNNTEKIQEISFHAEYAQARSEYQHAASAATDDQLVFEPSAQMIEIKEKVDSLHIKTLIFDNIIPAVWLCGAAISGLFMLIGGFRLNSKIKKSAIPLETARYESALQNGKKKLGMKRQIRIVIQGYVRTPALFGLFRPRIILPDYADNQSDEHLEYIILHELSHLKRGDNILNALLIALQSVYWFNPLIWLLFKFIREDMEVANDATVIKILGLEKQKEYSLSLLAVLTGFHKLAFAPRLLCLVDNEKNLERRISMMRLGNIFRKRKWIIAVTGIIVISVIATLFLTIGAESVNKNDYRTDITSDITDQVDRISRGYYLPQVEGDNFLITASKIHGAYKEDGKVRIFVTTYYGIYSVEKDKIMQLNARVVPAAITIEANPVSERGWLDYTEAQEGKDFRSSILDFCKLPSGKTIKGLADDIISYNIDSGELTELFQARLAEYIERNDLQGHSLGPVIVPLLPDKPKTPGIHVTIEEYFGGADTAFELIYEDEKYKYSLSSIRSDKIMLIFDDKEKLSLKDAITQNKISIDDLILNGLQVWMEPKDNRLAGYFDIPIHPCRFYIDGHEFFPSNIFMYTTQKDDLKSLFAIDEFLSILEAGGYQEEADKIRVSYSLWSYRYPIAGIEYVRAAHLESFGVKTDIEGQYSSHTPVKFSFTDTLGEVSQSTPDDPLAKVYLGMTVDEVYELFGKPDLTASGLAWIYYNKIGLFDPSFGFEHTISRISIGDKDWDVDALINEAITARSGISAGAGQYLTESHNIMKFNADKNGFTAEVLSICGVYGRKDDYHVEIKNSKVASVRLTFVKNKHNDYELSSYHEWQKGEDWGWHQSSVIENLESDCYRAAMYHFIGALPSDGRYGIGVGTAALTNVAESDTDSGFFIIKYFPGATLQIERYTDEWAEIKPQTWVVEYIDHSKNITIGKEGSDVITITDDLIGIYNLDENEYTIKFEKYKPN